MTSVLDILLIVTVLFATGVSIVFVNYASGEITDALVVQPTINNTPHAVEVLDSADEAVGMSDYLYLAGFVGFFLAVIVFGWIVGGLPIFAPVYFVIVCIFTFVAVILQLTWGDVRLQIPVMVAELPITDFIMSNLGYFTAVVGLVAVLVMFAKPRDSL